MRLIAQVIVAAMLLTGISFAKGPRYKSSRNYYSDDYRWRDRDYRERYNNRYRSFGYGNSYRDLPRGLQKKLYRGRALPPGYTGRTNRNGWYRDSHRYDRYWR
jgi:hypothetical protein